MVLFINWCFHKCPFPLSIIKYKDAAQFWVVQTSARDRINTSFPAIAVIKKQYVSEIWATGELPYPNVFTIFWSVVRGKTALLTRGRLYVSKYYFPVSTLYKCNSQSKTLYVTLLFTVTLGTYILNNLVRLCFYQSVPKPINCIELLIPHGLTRVWA